MIRPNLRKLWRDGEGRLLLINIANQLESGVIGPREISSFLRRAASPEADFSTRGKALAYQWDEMRRPVDPSSFFKGPVCDNIPDDTLVLRVLPFKKIIENVVFLEEGAKLQGDIIDVLNGYLSPAISSEDAEQAEAAIRENMTSFADGAGSAAHWCLPREIAALGPVACRFGRRSLKFNDKALDVPVFVAPVTGPEGSVMKLYGSAAPDGSANLFRDRLGLDHFGEFYKDSRTVIGGMLMRTGQIVGSSLRRPTPLDDTSKARFRGAHGAYGGRRGSMGRTADLSLAEGDAAQDGCVELVAKDVPFSSSNREVLIFYFGAVKNPLVDAYQEGVWGERDDAFAASCLGGGRRLRSLARIALAARRTV